MLLTASGFLRWIQAGVLVAKGWAISAVLFHLS